MSKRKRIWALMKNGGLFVIIVALTFRVIFFNTDFKEIITTIAQVNIRYIAIGVAVMLIVVLCEAINIRRSLKLFGEKAKLLQCVQYSFIGIFFSSVTPAATGGQPMQVYFMHKKKIDVSKAMLALLICLATYQFVTVSMAVIALIVKFNFFSETIGKFNLLLFLGIGLNVILLVLLLIAIFSKKFIFKVVSLCVKILSYFNSEKSIIFNKKALLEIEKYKKSADYIKKDKVFIVKTIITTIVQISALHSIPFWVYRAFGMSTLPILEFIYIQAALYITGAALPFPGAVGIGESGFLVFFQTIFPIQILSSAMLLSRGISFYLMILISGIGIMFLQLSLSGKLNIMKKDFKGKNRT